MKLNQNQPSDKMLFHNATWLYYKGFAASTADPASVALYITCALFSLLVLKDVFDFCFPRGRGREGEKTSNAMMRGML